MERRRDEGATDPVLRLLINGLAELGLEADLAPSLVRLCVLLSGWAARMNLTGHRTPEAIARRLVLDALALGQVLPARPPPSLADLGSGAGFPGLPLAVRWPLCAVTLVEARERRHHFQRAALRELGLSNVTPLRGRVEGLEPRPHALVIAQALAQPARALSWMRCWTEPGGWLALAQSADAPRFEAPADLEQAQTVEYSVPLGGPRRALWTARLPGGRPAGDCGT